MTGKGIMTARRGEGTGSPVLVFLRLHRQPDRGAGIDIFIGEGAEHLPGFFGGKAGLRVHLALLEFLGLRFAFLRLGRLALEFTVRSRWLGRRRRLLAVLRLVGLSAGRISLLGRGLFLIRLGVGL